ncbi:MAG: calcium-translocating P-type ATPase, PMCA-type [Clostridiales bacterium]|nr:calcium-translocating P-type ATPase, PMCA-type [Clostridiales bacterium]
MKKNVGLTTQEAIANKAKGSNALTVRERESFWDMLKESFSDTWIKILMVALVLEVVFFVVGQIWPGMGSDDWFSAVAIFIVICAVTFIGTYINYKQERGAEALQREASQIKVKVYRDGELVQIPIDEVVWGDCVFLQPGDKVPADGILIEGSLKVDQAALNGESREAEKLVLPEVEEIPTNDDLFTKFKCFRGSVVTSGSAIMQVTDVGDNTVLGTINVSLQEKVETKTPSEEKLDRLAKNIGMFGYIGGSAAALINLILGFINMSTFTVGSVAYLILSSVILGVSIIVMAVPEGLPLMNTLVQGLNVGKMLKAHIYVKNPKAIETAGYLTRIFTDKTGTLTKGKMTVANVITGDSNVYTNFKDICGEIREDIVIGAGVNNDAVVSAEGKPLGSNDTDRALISYLAIDNGEKIDKSRVVFTEAFDSRVKYASVTLSDGTKYFKGAPDIIMKDCTSYIDDNGVKRQMTDAARNNLMEAWSTQTGRAMRVIAIVKEVNGERIFVAMVSIRDDVRQDVKATIKKMHSAGVKVTMVTGDVIATAKAIAKEAGLVSKTTDICITHDELGAMSDDELIKILPNLKVVARAVPSDKERLVKVSQSIGEVVGMTGDGVNDASALHKADVGFAMGSGTEVAKEAGDIIILNDSLTSIADAIMYGRTMSKSVKKFIIFQLTVNVSTVFTAVLGPILGWTEVFSIVQILWINMIMDTLAAIAFGQEPARQSYMNEKPIARTADILNGYLKTAILTGGVFITVICLGILKNAFGIHSLIGTTNLDEVRSFMFATFILAILWNSLNARTESVNLFENISKNRNFILVMGAVAIFQILIMQVGGVIFGTTPLSISNWIIAILIAFMIIPIDLVRKVIVKKMGIKE